MLRKKFSFKIFCIPELNYSIYKNILVDILVKSKNIKGHLRRRGGHTVSYKKICTSVYS